MRKFILGLIAFLFAMPALAQNQGQTAVVVSACGTPPSTYTVGQVRQLTQDTTGKGCTGATVTPGGTQNVNVLQIGSTATATGNGTTNAGTQRVTISSDSTGTLAVVSNPVVVTPTDRGGTISTGGTAQNAMAANASRKGGWCQNPVNATEDLYISTSTTATVGGAGNDADLAPGGSFSFLQGNLIIQTAISVNATTTGHLYICKETQ